MAINSPNTREWEKKYAANISGLAKANNVDLGVASAMLKSNLSGTTNYSGGGVLNFNTAKADFDAANQADRNSPLNQSNLRKSTGVSRTNDPVNSPSPAPLSDPDPVEDYYSNYLADQQAALRASKEEAERAAQLRTQSAVDMNNAYIPQVNKQTDKQLQEAYIAAQQAKVAAPQSLAALGYSGGAAESSLMGLDANYQNNRNELETSRNTSLDSIRQNAGQIQATGNVDLANLASQYYSQMADAQAKAQQNAQEQANWQKKFEAEQQANERDQFTDTIGAYYSDYMAKANAVQNDGDESNDWQIPYLMAAREQKKLDQAQSTMTYAEALRAYNAGITTPEVLAVLGL